MNRGISYLKIVYLFLIVVSSGCATVQSVSSAYVPNYESFVKPEVGQISVVSVGETIISQGVKAETPAIRLNTAYRTEWIRNSGSRAFPFTFESGTVLKRVGSIQGIPIYVGPSVGGILGAGGNQIGAPYGLGTTDQGDVLYVYAGGGVISEIPGRTLSFSKRLLTTEDDRNFKQELLYNGRNDEEVFFTYREYVNDLARPAFTQNVRYSLKNSEPIGFKDLRIKVIEATNSDITYSIIQPFNLAPSERTSKAAPDSVTRSPVETLGSPNTALEETAIERNSDENPIEAPIRETARTSSEGALEADSAIEPSSMPEYSDAEVAIFLKQADRTVTKQTIDEWRIQFEKNWNMEHEGLEVIESEETETSEETSEEERERLRRELTDRMKRH